MRIVTQLLAAVGIGLLSTASVALADETFSPTRDEAGTVDVTPAMAEADTWNQLVEVVGVAPYGTSFSPVYDFGAGVEVDALRARLFQYVGETCGASLYSVDIATDPAQRVLTRYTPDANGEIALPNTRIYKVGFVLNQTRARGGRCIIRLHGLTADGSNPTDPTDPTTPDYVLAGVVSYVGGFRHQEVLSLATADKISSFMVRIPTFCSDVEVLEGGTITEGVYEAAQLVDARRLIFSVNGGAGSRVSAVALSLNGPMAARCDVPVYVKKVR